MYPKKFDNLIALLEKLPGVGNKTAQRYAFSLLNSSQEEVNEAIESLKDIKKIKQCKTCGFITDEDECVLCKDKTRDKSTILVVAYSQDMVAIEKTESYKGLYHVLNGLISSTKGIYPEDLKLDKLLNRITPTTKEIIIATSPTLDGEMTALYLDKILKGKGVLVTRLAHGLPMGSNLDYADDLTLIKALDNRRKITQRSK